MALPRLRENLCQSVVIGRYWCESCAVVSTVVRSIDTSEVMCPRCGQIAEPASGDEV